MPQRSAGRGRAATRGRTAALVLAVLTGLTTGCDSGSEDPAPPSGGASGVTVTSPAFGDGEAIPTRFSCDGDGVSPPLAWSSDPKAAAYAVVVSDPDAPGSGYVHWVVVDIAASVTAVAEGVVPAGGVELTNSSGQASYAPPCPPSGTHHYLFTVYALSQSTGLGAGASLADGFAGIADVSIAHGTLTATYTRP